MNIYLLCKRYYTNKDLINDRFGRLYHMPVQLAQQGCNVFVDAIDYRNRTNVTHQEAEVSFSTVPAGLTKIPRFLCDVYCHARLTKPDILIASGDIYIGYAGLQIARRLGALFVFDVYDYYPVFRINRFPGAMFIFNQTVKSADLVLCASEPLLQTVQSGLNKKALLIENGVDRTLFTHGDQRHARQALNLPVDIPVIGYFGSITPTRGPLLIEACRKLREIMPSLRLLLAGRISDVCIAEPWIHYLGVQAQQSIPTLIQACDVVSVPYAGDVFNRMSGACKIAEYLACGKPVVATRVSNHEQIFADVPSSLCDPTVDDMARAILGQLEYPQIAPFPDTLNWQSIGRSLHDSLIKLVE